MKSLIGLLLVLSPSFAMAEPIQFPDEELARESVTPIFDRPDAVMNRSVVTAKRFELGPTGGWTPTDAFFNPFSYGLTMSYHFNETHGLNILGTYRMGGTSQYTEQLNNIQGKTPLHLEYGPAPKHFIAASYQFTGYYGKLSFSKSTVSNVSTFGLLGAGIIGIGEETVPLLNIGVGQKYYMGSSFALRFDFRVVGYNGPYILSKDLKNARSTQPASTFDKKFMIDTMLTLGAVFLVPGS